MTEDAAIFARVTDHQTRERWEVARNDGIGSSDAPVIMGVAPPTWGSPYSLWTYKTGLAVRRFEPNFYSQWGSILEPALSSEYEKETGRKLVHLGDYAIRQHPTLPFMRATHDRIILPGHGVSPPDGRSGPGILSIKTAAPQKAGEWVEEAPVNYQVQLQDELAVSGFQWGSFVVLIYGKGMVWYDVTRNDRFIEALEDKCTTFWKMVTDRVAPPVDDTEATELALRARYLRPGEEEKWLINQDDLAIVDGWAEAKRALSAAEARELAWKNKVLDLIKDATVINLGGERGRITYRFTPEKVLPPKPETTKRAYRTLCFYPPKEDRKRPARRAPEQTADVEAPEASAANE